MRQLTHPEVKRERHQLPFSLLCSGWRDPLNVGAAFRLADAAGLQLILSDGTPQPPHPKIARTARSTERSVDWKSVARAQDFLLDFRRLRHRCRNPRTSTGSDPSQKDLIRAEGQEHETGIHAKVPALPGYVLAFEITDQSTSLLDYQLPAEVVSGQQALCLVPGAEAQGVSQELLDLCDASVHLPMYGQNSSMNVGVALGAAVYLLLATWR
ncbi:MAG: TrmH family RNA methyltransferase [Bacteroidota bacterium]